MYAWSVIIRNEDVWKYQLMMNGELFVMNISGALMLLWFVRNLDILLKIRRFIIVLILGMVQA